MEGELLSRYTTVKEVDDAILKRYLELVESSNPEDLSKLLDSWAKYISARRNSDVFSREETSEEKLEREAAQAIQEALKA